MYNTWRSLESQFSQMRRLPMFIKAELKFCHSCRIMKTRCNCFDYSQLEASYQETDQALRYAALQTFPVNKDDSEDEDTTDNTEPSRRTSTRSSGRGAQTIQPRQSVGFDYNTGVARVADEMTAQSICVKRSPSPVSSHAGRGSPMRSTLSTTTSSPTPTLVKFELRTIIIAREKINTHTRRWQCRFGLTNNPADPVCKREDDNMETIRRHYGREHGTHRFYKRPTLRIRCSNCDHVHERQRPPIKCPGCKVDRGIWLREIFAIVEVPVPLDTPDQTVDTRLGVSDNVSYPAGPLGLSHSPGSPAGPTSGSPSGLRSVHSHRSPLSRHDDNVYTSTIPQDPDTNMPQCYSDICNNTTALPVMPPPNTINTTNLIPRPSSSSSASSAVHPQVPSPFTQGFYTLSHGLPISPIGRMANPSPSSPSSIASSSTYDIEATAMLPLYSHLGAASAVHRAHLVDRAMANATSNDTGLYGGPVDGVGSISAEGVVMNVGDAAMGLSGGGNGAGNQVAIYADMLGTSAADEDLVRTLSTQPMAQAQAQIATMHPPAHPETGTVADFQMYLDLASRQAAEAAPATSSPGLPFTANAPAGKCAIESKYYDLEY
ncbi:hypothetical protein SBRCBS47491_005096 [Sporothrix bragantina]|uniref:Rubrerythrin rubredoxin-like domain-containing protein n=1 Tax=Sporothrix bragantina TaxID=671064 RepID=A0ABP0BU43_9PEZI